MELKLEAVEEGCLPAGCVVGVRIGDVLKQGKYEPNRSYSFPQLDRRRNAKIDLYKHIGSCVVGVDPENGSSSEVSVTSNDPSFAGIKLKVNALSSISSEADRREKEGKTRNLKSKAKEYLQEHSIEERLAQAVKALLKEQPADPTAFLCAQLRGQNPAPAAAAADEPPPAPEVTPALVEELSPADLLRLQARDALVLASNDGSLQKVLEDIKLDKVRGAEAEAVADDTLRQEACDILAKASLDGRLNQVLNSILAEKGVAAPPASAAAPPAAAPPAAPLAAAAAAPAALPPAAPASMPPKSPAMLMSSIAVQGPAFASMGIQPTMCMI